MAGTLVANTINTDTGLFSTNNAYSGIAKAWVTFTGGNGNTAGTVSASFNVSSVTVNGSADYTVNFSTAMPNTVYCVICGCQEDEGNSTLNGNRILSPARTTTALQTTSVRLVSSYTAGGSQNNIYYGYVAIFSA